MTTSHIQPRKITANIFDLNNNTVKQNQIRVPVTQTVPQMKEVADAHSSSEMQHFTTGSIGAGYAPFDANNQMFFMAQNQNS